VDGYAVRVADVSPRKKPPDIINILHGLLEHDTAGDSLSTLCQLRSHWGRVNVQRGLGIAHEEILVEFGL
jgi:hypothetical protein